MTDLATITQKIAAAVGENSGLGKTVKVDFCDAGKILINATDVPNVVSNEDGPADTTIQISIEDLMASISSEKQISRVAQTPPVIASNACRTMVVRATSPKVPICGRPDGP